MAMNCNEIVDDKDSVISDRCWEEKYRGDSRKWIVRDGTTQKSRGMVCSTMRDEFQVPEPDEQRFLGIRRAILQNKLREEVAREIIEENSKNPPIEEYCTEYDGNFNYPGYDSEKKEEPDTELYLKYPLYSSQPTTYWKFQVDAQPRGQASLPGFTVATDIKCPFRRNSQFSKRISEVLDADSL